MILEYQVELLIKSTEVLNLLRLFRGLEMPGREIRRLPAEVIYDPEAASLYIQLKKRVALSRAIDRNPRGDGRDITLIILDYDASGGLSGIEILLNPNSQLKQTLDNDFKNQQRIGRRQRV